MKAFLRSAVLAWVMCGFPLIAAAQVSVSVSFGPPVIPVYAQPPVPAPGYIWTPGYWAWDGTEYVWVPGAWVMAPVVGYLWTPPWWGWSNGLYVFHPGYWGPSVGFYGGIDYGYGYGGTGYAGGYWRHNRFFYNRAVNNITDVTRIHNTYNKTVINNVNVTRISYNGGPNGIHAQPNAAERAAARQAHVQATVAQVRHREQAMRNRTRPGAGPNRHASEPRGGTAAMPGQTERAVPRPQPRAPRKGPATERAPSGRQAPNRVIRPAAPRPAPANPPQDARPARPRPRGMPHAQRAAPPRRAPAREEQR